MKNKPRVLVVGAGLTGASAARVLAERGCYVEVHEARSVVGGLAHDFTNETGRVHKYGPHVFHTNNDSVWNFLSRFQLFTNYEHTIQACTYDGTLINVPITLDFINATFGPEAVDLIVKTCPSRFPLKAISESIPEVYQWFVDNLVLSEAWIIEYGGIGSLPVCLNGDRRFYDAKHQGVPCIGYTNMVQRMLCHADIKIKHNTPYRDHEGFDGVVYTGPIDEFFNYSEGKLLFHSVVTTRSNVAGPTKSRIESPVVELCYESNYHRISNINRLGYDRYEPNQPTFYLDRLVDFNGSNDRWYPMRSDTSHTIYNKYVEMSTDPNIIFAGWLGRFKYISMDQAVQQGIDSAIAIFDFLSSNHDLGSTQKSAT